jgi:hypothetical protein
MALAGKGEIMPESVMTRAITIRMQRRTGLEKIEDFLTPSVKFEASEIVEHLESWLDSCGEELEAIEPDMPVLDRDREVWLPLVKVAELASLEWREKALSALLHHQKIKEGNPLSRERQLLSDVYKIFETLGTDRIPTPRLLEELCSLPDSEWTNFSHGKPINERNLAKKLRTYEIKPAQIRFQDRSSKGYYKGEVEQAYKRYVEADTQVSEETSETSETLFV